MILTRLVLNYPANLNNTITYSGKVSCGHICVSCIQKWKLHVEQWENFVWTLTSQHMMKIKCRWLASLVFYQIFKQPTQRLVSISLISQQKLNSWREMLCYRFHSRWACMGTVWQLKHTKLKRTNIYSVGFFCQIYKNLHRWKFRIIWFHDLVKAASLYYQPICLHVGS